MRADLMPYLEPTLRAAAAVIVVIALTRLNGLRSFAKMSAFDFALTIATGSVLASVILPSGSTPGVGLAAIAGIFVVQRVVSVVRQRSTRVKHLADNAPLLLMDGPRILHDNLRAARVPESDVLAKLRAANVLSVETVRAVVLETTGDISVLHGPSSDPDLDEGLLRGVRRS